jgi:phage terminase large subunit-like protein
VTTWNLACPDWRERLREGRSLVPDLPLFESEASAAVEFFNALHLPDVPGKPLLEDAAGDWFRDIVRALFGSRDPATNIRHIREIFALVGKGNSKTTYGAGLMMTALLMNKRPSARFLLVAPTQDTSALAFDAAKGMIEDDEELSKRFHIRDHIKVIKDRLTKAELQIKTFGLDALTGPKPTGVLVDELHLLGKSAHTTKVMRQIRGGLEKMTEGFLLIITTQSDDRPAGAFKDELTLARGIRDGKFEGRMLPILYELPEDIAKKPERWQDPAVWPMVMPNLGRSLQLDSLVQDWTQENRKGPHAISVWASQHLNIEIGVGQKTDGWPGAAYWDRQADEEIEDLEALLDRCEVAVVGVDGGGLDDLFGLYVLGRERGGGRWLGWAHGWAHPILLERRKSIESVLRGFAEADEVTLVDDDLQDIEEIVAIVERIKDRGLLGGVGVDPAGIGALVEALDGIGVTAEKGLVGVNQGFGLMNAIKTAERKLVSRQMVHCGSALAGWCVGNLKIEPTATAVRATKQNAGDAKIDVAMALFNAVFLMVRNPEPLQFEGTLDAFLEAPLYA